MAESGGQKVVEDELCCMPWISSVGLLQNFYLRTFVGTWNVGGKTPNNDLNLNDWLRTDHFDSPSDVYVLGFQEIVPLNAGNVLGPGDSGMARKWLSLVHAALNPDPDDDEARISSSDDLISSLGDNFSSLRSSSCSSEEEGFNSLGPSSSTSTSPIHEHLAQQHKYRLAASKQMVGIFLCVWVRQGLYGHISRTKISCVGTGLMGCLGNKGSVSISMTLDETTFCFVCTHLASGEKRGDAVRRNSDVAEILKRTRFSNSCKPEQILDHDNIIWLGDLNYRLASICCNTYELLERQDWQALMEKDQLRVEQKADGGVFKGWEEGDISFAPTYKYLTNSDKYYAATNSYQDKPRPRRTPAWCDRILWKGEGIKQMCYERSETRFSDHRPVYSLFSVHLAPHSNSDCQ
ncbi:type IV inositol polyphosphate 5-phosphatase 6-like isoform X2 [Andrographis paniculata]|uniref:type IV inositol polyphosphate 5-phosphatase 6-like isoform X2 n=1 Tax=Andrographis paniculata TaxID=175694 RepID=UPI0021E75740|nr:type IV inositol polyphosphate 5-phosphatase 6-like isoform X2 [Andrographis paniculata]